MAVNRVFLVRKRVRSEDLRRLLRPAQVVTLDGVGGVDVLLGVGPDRVAVGFPDLAESQGTPGMDRLYPGVLGKAVLGMVLDYDEHLTREALLALPGESYDGG